MKKSATPDPASLAAARAMRRFDPKLTDEQIVEIARAIDENATVHASLNSGKYPLDNAVAPIAVVRPPS